MGILKEFKEFAVKGNVIDMAVGVVIGAAFGKIVGSLVSDIIMPAIGPLTGNVSFKDKFFTLDGKSYESLKAAQDAGAPAIAYGTFLDTIINFVIVAFAIFMVIKQINRMKSAPPPPAAPTTRECPYCVSLISKKASRCPQCTAQVQPA